MAGASAALLAVEPGPWSASAPCKRALRGASCGAMKEMFGKDQLSAMADLVQGSLMLLLSFVGLPGLQVTLDTWHMTFDC